MPVRADFVTYEEDEDGILRARYWKIGYIDRVNEKFDKRWLTTDVVDLSWQLIRGNWNIAPLLIDALIDAACDHEELHSGLNKLDTRTKVSPPIVIQEWIVFVREHSKEPPI